VNDIMTFMIVTRRTTFRLYPTKSQEVKLHYWRRLHKDLFNACLYHRKTAYQRFGNSISYYDQQNILPEFKECWQHKVAAQIVSSNSLVATEKLNIKGMTRKATAVRSSRETRPHGCLKKDSKRKHQKTGLNRSLLDVGIGNLISLIKYKLSECSGVFVDVPLKIAPSQTCPQCGYKKKKELSERVHNCENCNFTADRDVAASMVMLNYAKGLGTSLSNADAEPLSETTQNCGSFRKVQQLKRQKPRT